MNNINIEKFTKALSDILSRKHGAKITITATPKGAPKGTPRTAQGR